MLQDIPVQFSRRTLNPNMNNATVTLRDGRQFICELVISLSACSLTNGWNHVYVALNLNVGDSLLFDVVDAPRNEIQVSKWEGRQRQQ